MINDDNGNRYNQQLLVIVIMKDNFDDNGNRYNQHIIMIMKDISDDNVNRYNHCYQYIISENNDYILMTMMTISYIVWHVSSLGSKVATYV